MKNRKYNVLFLLILWPFCKGENAYMKKIFSFFILFILVNLAAIAQEEQLFSSYMLLKPVTNPAFTGSGTAINAVFVNRTMFAGIGEGKPVTSAFGVEAPVDILGAKSGLGIVIMSDALGFFDDVNVDLSYAYHHSLEGGRIGGGITLGLNNYSITPEYVLPDGDSWSQGDEFFPDQYSTLSVGIGLGVYYETSQYYLGGAVTNINQPNVVYAEDKSKPEVNVGYYPATYYLNGGYNIALPDPLFDLQPTFLLRTDLAMYMLDLNGTVYYNNKYWAGLGLRLTPGNLAATSLLAGLELVNGLKVGYALDVNLGGMMLGGASSHEIMVTYSFSVDTKRDQKYKSVRYL